MGTSSDGQLNYGIPFDEDTEFPWDGYEEIDDWWEVVKGYTPIHKIWNADGEYEKGFSSKDPRIDTEYSNKRKWWEENPLPIELVYYCSYDYPMYLISLKGLGFRVCRGEAGKFDLDICVADGREKILDFCEEYKIETPCEPDWYLTSMYG